MNVNMKKKEYKKPLVIEIEMTCQDIIAGSPFLDINNEPADPDIEVQSLPRRDVWGNIWK